MKKAKRILFALLLLLFAVTLMAMLDHSTLVARNVEVEGNVYMSDEQVASLTGLTGEENLLRVDLDAVKQNLERTPYLQVESLSRRLPDTLIVKVKERVAAACVTYSAEADMLVDAAGLILEIVPQDMTRQLMRVSGMRVSSVTAGSVLQAEDEYQSVVLRSILGALDKASMLGDFSLLDLSVPESVTMETTTGLAVTLGQAVDLDEKFANLHSVLTQLYGEGITDGTVNAMNKDRISYSPAK